MSAGSLYADLIGAEHRPVIEGLVSCISRGDEISVAECATCCWLVSIRSSGGRPYVTCKPPQREPRRATATPRLYDFGLPR